MVESNEPGAVDGWWGTRREPASPVPVWVDLAVVLPPKPLADRREVPLRVRACGIDSAQVIDGELIAWHRVISGAWWALVRMNLPNRSGRASLPIIQLVAADAVRQRPDE